MKILTILGARPQFIKAAPISRAFREAGFEEQILHTGQHYDASMSKVFFEELEIPAPTYNLALGGGSHGEMTGRMLEQIEAVMLKDRPDWVLVFGDTNSTLAGALAAAKLHVQVCHVEAGLRSYNRVMPEEVNRVMTDHLSELLFCSSEEGVANLQKEGITKGVQVVGDVMCDASQLATAIVERDPERYLTALPKDTEEKFGLLTLHRAENVGDEERLSFILKQLGQIESPLILPLHPGAAKMINLWNLKIPSNIKVIDPVGYLEMAALLSKASLVLTDSGGLQKEAYWAKVPCVTIRTETEWTETTENGWNHVIGDRLEELADVVNGFQIPLDWEQLYGTGNTAELIAASLAEHSSASSKG